MTILFLFQSCLQMDIILLCDYSGSMGTQDRQHVEDAVQVLVDRFKHEDGVRIGIMLFGTNQVNIQDLSYAKDIGQVEFIDFQGHNTYIGQAFQAAKNQLYQDRLHAYKTIILISDGEPDAREYSLSKADELRSTGIIICSVQVSEEGDWQLESKSAFMKLAATSENFYISTNYSGLAGALKKLGLCL